MTARLDPFADWDSHDFTTCAACSEFGVVEHFDLLTIGARLAALPPEPGHWANPASLTRFDQTSMDHKMLTRFLLKVEPTQLDFHTPCWLWKGGTHDKGYGRFYLGSLQGKRIHAYAHRISFEHWIGMPPAGYIVDHQCNHKLCCNPTHLWPETNNNNLRLADERRPWKRRNQYSQE
jgi:hypothetical protein